MRDTLGSPGNRLTATENKELIIRNTIAGLVRPLSFDSDFWRTENSFHETLNQVCSMELAHKYTQAYIFIMGMNTTHETTAR